MFKARERSITLSAGDTGVVGFRFDVPLTDDDRGVFTVADRKGKRMLRKIIRPEGNTIYIPFVNSDTQDWEPGGYEWDLRVVLGATLAGGDVTDGREVITPFPPGVLTVVKVVGKV